MSSESRTAAGRREYYRLQGEVTCLRRLLHLTDGGKFALYNSEIVVQLRDATDKLDAAIRTFQEARKVKRGKA